MSKLLSIVLESPYVESSWHRVNPQHVKVRLEANGWASEHLLGMFAPEVVEVWSPELARYWKPPTLPPDISSLTITVTRLFPIKATLVFDKGSREVVFGTPNNYLVSPAITDSQTVKAPGGVKVPWLPLVLLGGLGVGALLLKKKGRQK